ncbi:MAG: hydantoinase B/oxoprolinase family protein, partial [Alphaproteobacteria bacterium]
EVEYGPVDCRMEAGFVHDGNIHVPDGARSGLPAARSNQFKRTHNRELEQLEQCSIVWIEDGETLVSIAQGGGGYGDPRSREPESVAKDVREGLVSRERAETIYAVAIADDLTVDAARTAQLRNH